MGVAEGIAFIMGGLLGIFVFVMIQISVPRLSFHILRWSARASGRVVDKLQMEMVEEIICGVDELLRLLLFNLSKLPDRNLCIVSPATPQINNPGKTACPA